MATFNPQAPGVRAHINVRQGVVDNTASQVVGAAWDIGREAWQGYAQAQLVGAEADADLVEEGVDYGAFEFDDDNNPVRLSVDQDLTRIASARRQNRITSGRASALVNLRIREAINATPMFAEELQNRAERFFNNELGSGGRGSSIGGNLLRPTPAESLQQELMEDRAKELADEQLQAEMLGVPLETYRRVERIKWENAVKKDMLESGQELTAVEVQQGVSAAMHEAEDKLLANITALRKETGGLLNEAHRDSIKQDALLARNKIISTINGRRAELGDRATKMEENVSRWYDNFEELVESGNLEAMSESMLKHIETSANLQNWGEMPEVMRMFSASKEFGEWFMTIAADPDRAAALSTFVPGLKFFSEQGYGGNFDVQGIISAYQSQAGAFLSGQGDLYPRDPRTGEQQVEDDQTLETMTDEMAARSVADGQGTPRSLARLRNLALDTPASVSALTTRANRARMAEDPAYRQQAGEVFNNAVRGLERKLLSGEYDLSALDIRELSRREQTLRDSPRGRGIRGTEFRSNLQNTKVEVKSDAMRQYIEDRRYGVPDITHPREAARTLQSLITAAELYPDMEVNGMPAREYLDKIIRQGAPDPTPEEQAANEATNNKAASAVAWAMNQLIPAAPASTGEQDMNVQQVKSILDRLVNFFISPAGTPTRLQQPVEDLRPGFEEVEFNDQTIAGEEGSMVGGIEHTFLGERVGDAPVASAGIRGLQDAIDNNRLTPAVLQHAGIDYAYVRGEEEHQTAALNLKGFVPLNNEGKPAAKSGVTVGTGVDFGQQSEAGLRRRNIDEDLIEKVKPYLGVKQDAAVELLEEQPLDLTQEEVDQLNVAFLRSDLKELTEVVPEEELLKLEPEARTVLLSHVRNLGKGSLGWYTTNLIIEGKYAEAAKRLEDPKGSGYTNRILDPRRKREAALLRKAAERVAAKEALQEA